MSSARVSKTEVDAMVTVALRWTERGDVAQMVEPARTVLHVDVDNATAVGRRLWQPNSDLAPDVPLPAYSFDPLKGFPPPAVAFQLGSYYEYQFAGDHWEDDPGWNDAPPPFESYFVTALQWHAAVLLGMADAGSFPAFDPEGEHLPDLRGIAEYDTLPWGFGDEDRDIFLKY